LTADGAVGPATLAALNVPAEARVAQIRANLERARWVLYDPESEFLVVNIASFQLYLVRRGEIVWRTRVQVGRPYRQTPVFRADLTYLVFNPTWTVPPTILREDILPELRRDPGYLAARHIEVIDAAGGRVDPAAVDWSARSFPHRLVQTPGADNALGRVKFMFPNEYSVYLHDTPSRGLYPRREPVRAGRAAARARLASRAARRAGRARSHRDRLPSAADDADASVLDGRGRCAWARRVLSGRLRARRSGHCRAAGAVRRPFRALGVSAIRVAAPIVRAVGSGAKHP
jgi:hypothetical protein